MSKTTSESDREERRTSRSSSVGREKEDNGATEITDTIERRRMQNRLAQRNHRKKVRDHISALEARVIESMLQGSMRTGMPSPPASTTNQYMPFSPTPDHLQQSTILDQGLDFSMDYSESMDQAFQVTSAGQSPNDSGLQNEYPTPPHGGYDNYSTPASSSASICSRCACCSDSLSPSATPVSDSFYQPHIPQSGLNPSSPFPDMPSYGQGIDSIPTSTEAYVTESHNPTTRSRISVTPPYSSEENNLNYASPRASYPAQLYPVPHQQHTWSTGVNPSHRVITLPPSTPPYQRHHQHHPSQSQSHGSIDPYLLRQSSQYVSPQSSVLTPGSQPQQQQQQQYVLVPISNLYPPSGLSPGSIHQNENMFPFPQYHYLGAEM